MRGPSLCYTYREQEEEGRQQSRGKGAEGKSSIQEKKREIMEELQMKECGRGLCRREDVLYDMGSKERRRSAFQ